MNAPDPAAQVAAASPMPHVMNTYGRLPMAMSHGRGCWLWDTDGKRYLDGLAGIAVNTLGPVSYTHLPRPPVAARPTRPRQ